MRTREVQPSRNEIKKIWEDTKTSNRACKIPAMPGEPPETNIMSNCHIISESFLRIIARKGIVYEWPGDPTVVANSALKEIKAGKMVALPRDVSKASQFKDRGTGIGHCVWRFACHYHDNRIFKSIDSTDIDLTSQRVRFLLGLRTIAATSTWLESYRDLFANIFPRRRRTKEIIRHYPQAQSMAPVLQEAVRGLKMPIAKLSKELEAWQDIYLTQPQGEYPIMTCHRTTTTTFGTAGAGIHTSRGQNAILVTMLPRKQNGQERSLCDIVVTCLRPSFWLKRLFLRWRIYREARRIERLLNKSPVVGIPILATELAFFYVSPDDYDDDTVVTQGQRQEIDSRIAKKRVRFH